jgi:tetratricopeptide (TPR) repeat protein
MAISNSSVFLGTVISVMGEFAEGDLLLRKGLSIKEGLDDPWGSAFCLRQIALSAHYRGDYTGAFKSLEESLSIARQIGNKWLISASLNQLGIVAHSQAKYDEARRYLVNGLELSRSVGDRASIAFALDGLGLVSTAQGRFDEAQHFLEESVALWSEIGEQGSLAATLNHLGETWLNKGDKGAAHTCFLEALRVATAAQITPVMLDSLIGEAEIRIQESSLVLALRILISVSQNPSSPHVTRHRATKLRSDVESQLPEARLKEISLQVEDKDVFSFAKQVLEAA